MPKIETNRHWLKLQTSTHHSSLDQGLGLVLTTTSRSHLWQIGTRLCLACKVSVSDLGGSHAHLCACLWSVWLTGGRRWLWVLCQASAGNSVFSTELLWRVWQRWSHDECWWDIDVLLPGESVSCFLHSWFASLKHSTRRVARGTPDDRNGALM